MHNSRKWLILSIILTLLIALPLFILASKNQQEVRSRASGPNVATSIDEVVDGNQLEDTANSNAQVSADETPSNTTSTNETTPNNPRLSKEVYGFIPYWEVNADADKYLQYNYLTTLAYFGLHLNPDGTINKTGHPYKIWAGKTMYQITVNAHNAGVKIHPTIVLFQGSNIHQMLANHQDTAINSIMDVLTNSPNPVDGVNIDFESPSSSDKTLLVKFIKNLNSAMTAKNPKWTIVYDTLGSSADSSNSSLPSLAPYVDSFFVMSYHFKDPSKATQAGSKNRYAVLQRVVTNYLKRVSPDKVILGFPLYTSAWKTTDGSLDSLTTGGAGQKLYRSIASDVKNINVNYDPNEKTAWYALMCGSSWEEVYYDNQQALDDKFSLITQNNLGGAGFWAFNQDEGSLDTWNAIYDTFADKTALPRPSAKLGFVTPAPTGNCKAIGSGLSPTAVPTGGSVSPIPTTINVTQAPVNLKSDDINGDGKVNLLDWNILTACSIFSAIKNEKICPVGSAKQKASDLDGNGTVDQDDITLWIKQYNASPLSTK